MKIEIEKPIVPVWFDDWYKTFDGNKPVALYHLNRTGWGYGLTDGNDCEVDDFSNKLKDLFGDSSYRDAQEYLSKAILLDYEVKKDPLYYAKIKGWKHIGTSSYYFGLEEDLEILEVTILENNYRYAFALTKEHWNKLGIDDSNADFEEVE